LKTVTVTGFMKFKPCYNRAKIKEIAGDKKYWTALDILRIESVSSANKLWAVLREELIDAPILHEFACRCAENALKLVDNPDPRSVAAIEAKRAWLRGEIDNNQLDAAWDAAQAAARAAALAAAWAAALDAAWAAALDTAQAAARAAALAAAQAAARAAALAAALDAAQAAAQAAVWDAVRAGQVKLYKRRAVPAGRRRGIMVELKCCVRQ